MFDLYITSKDGRTTRRALRSPYTLRADTRKTVRIVTANENETRQQSSDFAERVASAPLGEVVVHEETGLAFRTEEAGTHFKHRLAAILVNGDFRIHGEGCRDIARDAKESDAGEWYITARSKHEANIECWGDVASDDFEENTPEWHEECDKDAAIASRYLPCVPASLPDQAEDTQEDRT